MIQRCALPDPPSAPDATSISSEARRAALLHELGILDSGPEPEFDGLTLAASLVTGCPIAMVSLLDGGRQWFKSHHGLKATQTPIASSFCARAVRQPHLLEINDTLLDPQFAENPLVTGEPGIRFYAGQPLILDGVALGTLCVIDKQPGHLSDESRRALKGLARAVEGLLAARQSMADLRAQQLRLADLALASGDWLWETDVNGTVTWLTGHADAHLPSGASVPLQVGRALHDGPLVDGRGIALVPAASLHQRLAQRGRVTRANVQQAAIHGSAYLSFSALPQSNEAGGATGYRGTARDITAAVQDEQRRHDADLILRLERDAAQLSARLRSEVVASVSHELRTPLNAVVGFAQLLLRDPKEVLLYATHIRRAGTHLLALVNDMLELARLETGKTRLELRPVSTTGVMQRCLDLLKPEASRRGVRLQMQADADALVVMADSQSLTQAVLNLASNALKFSPPGGAVYLTAQLREEGKLAIAVRDEGAGIAADLIGLLFLPFSQLPGNRKNGGTGLGLAISRQLVQAMGGDISVESTVGHGATFTICLVAAEPGEREVFESTFALFDDVPPSPAATMLYVLYVEDDPVNALLLDHMLAHFGQIQTHHAASATEGTQVVMTRHFDLILLDMNLPDGHGLDVLAVLRANSRNADVPIVALSADALAESINAARAAGFDDYLTKPIDMTVLERLVSRLR